MLERREVDLRPLDHALRERGVRLCYPFMEREDDGGTLTGFRWVTEVTQLSEQGRQFAEPPRDAPRALPGEVQVVIVPALAVTLDGQRLGYGAGFYDATLPDLCPPARSIVVAFDFQLLMELPTDVHDLRCDAVVTDA
jgi:5-formyltetrahydrofolate cyclo-ligase